MNMIKTLYRFPRNKRSAPHKHSHSHLILSQNAAQNQASIVAQNVDNAHDTIYVPFCSLRVPSPGANSPFSPKRWK
jgi:NAD-dependent SIR2 family protein deacetylase